MTSHLTSQIVQLLYRNTPSFNLAHVVSEMCKTFSLADGHDHNLTWDCDDIALLDLNSTRLVIGFSDNILGTHAACVTVAVGQSPQPGCAPLTKNMQLSLCRRVTDLINQRYQSDVQQTRSLDQPLTVDLIDAVVDALYQSNKPDDQPLKLTHDLDTPDASAQISVAGPNDMDRLMGRLTSELMTRPPNLIARAIASASPMTRQNSSSPAYPLDTTKAMKSGSSLFWSRTKSMELASGNYKNQNTLQLERRAFSNELKAVRAALYTAEVSQNSGTRLISEKAKLAYLTLAALSHGLTDAVLSRRDTTHRLTGSRIEH